MTRCAVVGTRDNPSVAVLFPGQSWFPGAGVEESHAKARSREGKSGEGERECWTNPLRKLEPVVGIEPTTYGLRNRCSATELHRHTTIEAKPGGRD